MKNIASKYFSDKKNQNRLALIGGILVLIMIVLVPFSFAAETPIDRIEIKSENLNYDENIPGSFKITKSAKWISKGKAQITFDVDTIAKTYNKYRDIILVLDVSGSMDGEKLDKVKSDSIELVHSLLSDSNNRVALITFATDSQIISNLTNNQDELINKINNLGVIGNTNYYQALVNVDNILKDYQKEKDRELITLFLTDGYPNEDTPNEESQYKYLKEQYPYMIINGIQYEMGNDILVPIKKISDNQFFANINTLNNVLFEASVESVKYDNFNITDYIDTKYFTITDKNSIKVSQGEVTLSDNNSKVNWSISSLKSVSKVQMTIEVNLKDEYKNQGGIYPTNTKEEIKSLIDGVEENITSTLTPKLKTAYQVIYDANTPDGCSVENVPNIEGHSVFDTVTISDNAPKCTGYTFKGWKITTGEIENINESHFIMPEKDVTIRAEWSKVSIQKSMNGEVYNGSTLYQTIAQNSRLDNTSSEFVTSVAGINFANSSSDTNGKGIYELSSTKDDEYPVYYYRGNVTNNNVKFANYCWKIVRTTSTGGVKLIYNGVPDNNGNCNNTGTSSQIGTSAFNSSHISPADVSYMYGTRYIYSERSMSSTSSTSGFVYGNDVVYENGVYTLTDTMTSTGWSSDYKTIATKYHYTCFSTEKTCRSVYYIHYFANSSRAYYLTLNDGKNIEDAKHEMFTNTTNSTVKTAIDTWYQNHLLDYTDYLEDTVWCNDRSIYNGPLKGKDENSSSNTYSYFGGRGRNVIIYKPSVICPNINDSFTVSSSNGNGALNYPIALLTADEVTLAGLSWRKTSPSNYIYTGQYWWTLTPSGFSYNYAFQFEVHSYMYDSGKTSSYYGIRPSISLKPNTTIKGGDGSTSNPFIIE